MFAVSRPAPQNDKRKRCGRRENMPTLASAGDLANDQGGSVSGGREKKNAPSVIARRAILAWLA